MHIMLPRLRRIAGLLALTVSVSAIGLAVETRSWTEDNRSDFEKGKLKNLSVRSDGRLLLAPIFRELFDSSTPYLWDLCEDSHGNIYAGGGGPGGSGARVFVIDRNGKGRTLAELDGMEVHALAIDRQGRLYAATSPDGKVYRVASDGKAQVFYDPKAKYIWALAFDSNGNLYVATGDEGQIHRVTPDGKGSVFFKTEESHARSLAMDSQGNLIAGTEPGGLIIRITPAGAGYVLYQAPKREITSVAIAPNGDLYAAGVGNKTGAVAAIASPPVPSPSPAQAPRVGGAMAVQTHAAPATPILGSLAAVSATGGSEVYRIDREGYARKIWSDPADIVYTISFDPDGKPLLGTGNKGNIYRLDSDILSTQLISAEPTQVTNIRASQRGRMFAVTGNIGKVFEIGPGTARQGTIESDVFDTGSFSYWGRLSYYGSLDGGSVEFQSRTGNLDRPQQNWSSWAPVTLAGKGGQLTSPASRFVQWRATILAAPNGTSPRLDSVDVAYQARNVPPVLDAVEITPPNYRFPPATLTATLSRDITLPPLGKRSPATTAISISPGALAMNYAKGFLAVRWAASDENGDELEYRVEIRGVKETGWKLLKDHIKQRHYNIDGTSFPDGEYVVRVTASDAPDNPPPLALTTSLVSDPFLVDNAPPRIIGLTGVANGNKLTLRWKAKDELSNLGKAEYSLNGGPWTMVLPTTRLSDAPELSYELTLDRPSPGEQTVAVRIEDQYENLTVDKVVLR